MIERESFLFYRAYFNAANRMNPEQKANFYEIIFAYGLDGKFPEDTGDPLIDMALDFVRPLLGANIKNYVNGKKGGAPVGNKNNSKGNNQWTTGGQPMDNPRTTGGQGNVKVKDKDNVKVNENVNDKAKDNVNVKVNVKDKKAAPIFDENDDYVSEEEWQKRLAEEDDDW